MARKKRVSKKDIHFTLDKGLSKSKKNIIIGLDMSLRHSGVVILNHLGKIIHRESIIFETKNKTEKKQKKDTHKIFFRINNADQQQEVDVTNKDHSIDTIKRYIVIQKRIEQLVQKFKVTHACIEGPAYQGTGQKIQLAELTILIRVMLRKKKIPFYIASPKTAKKYISGNGNADKEQMQESILEKYDYNLEDDNEADAFGLARLLLDLGEETALYCIAGAPDVYLKQLSEKNE